jgi:hypothetical protein
MKYFLWLEGGGSLNGPDVLPLFERVFSKWEMLSTAKKIALHAIFFNYYISFN